MKQQFKSTLLAAAVAVSCGTAVAGTVSVTTQTYSKEGLAGVTANQTSNSISYTLAAAYGLGDKITFTFPTGSGVSASSYPPQINVPAVDSATASSAIAGMALGLLNSTADSVTYRVTSLSQPDNDPNGTGTPYTDRTTIGAVITLGAIPMKAAFLNTGADVTVAVSSETTAGDLLDTTGTRTGKLAQVKSQFGTAAATTKFDGVIDVVALRKAFAGATNDTMSWTVTNPATTGWLTTATVNATSGTSVNLYGEAGKMGNVKATQWASGGTRTFDAAGAKLSISYPGMVTNDTITFTPLTGTSAVVLEPQSFTTDIVYNYTSAGAVAGSSIVTSGLASGAWKLNGATVNIPYMPYGPNSSQIIYVSNSGSLDGDVSATVYDDKGKFYDLGILAVAGKQRVTKIAPQINDKLRAAGFDGTKASITITVNAPENNITIYSSYNVGGADRGYINTDQYKGK